MRSGNRVRITTRLVDPTTEQHLWAETYERELGDELTLQADVAQAIAAQIKINVTPQEQTRLGNARQVKPEVREAYLKGLYEWNKRTEQSLKKGITYFEQAIDKDPSYAAAYCSVALSYYILGENGYVSGRQVFPMAKAAARKALELDEGLGEAHAVLAAVTNVYDWDWPGAEKEFKQAIELDPGSATAHHFYAFHLSILGRHEKAMAEIQLARQFDPLSPRINANVGLVLCNARRYDQAIEDLQKVLDLDPHNRAAHYYLAQNYLQKGLDQQALAEYEKTLTVPGSPPYAKTILALCFALAGKRAEALKIMEEIIEILKNKGIAFYWIAILEIALGEKDQAFQWLEKAYQMRDPWLRWVKVDPRLDPLRSDLRFQDLLKRMKFPP
jgi:tetratricopeptide (TPR) repeat protein